MDGTGRQVDCVRAHGLVSYCWASQSGYSEDVSRRSLRAEDGPHNNAVIRAFYDFYAERGEGPLLNPMPRERGGRPYANHNPMEPFGFGGRLRYNPRAPRRYRRALTDAQWDGLFSELRSNRDRALLALAVSTAARAGELLGLRGCDVDWGDQLILVKRKGSGAMQWLPASSEAFTWLRLWINELDEFTAEDMVWQTLRRRGVDGGDRSRSVLTYDVLRRANTQLGSNWTMHDLRHTCALRMLRGRGVSLRDVQIILGHAHLSTTQIYLEVDDSDVIARVHRHLTEREQQALPTIPTAGYDPADLAVLLGTTRFDGAGEEGR